MKNAFNLLTKLCFVISKFRFFLIFNLFIILVFTHNVWGQTPTTYTISLPPISRPLQEDMLGFNGMNITEPSSSWNTLNTQSNNLNIFKLSPSTLRYPGGTVANFWDWRSGWFLKETELPSGLDLPEEFKNRDPLINKENSLYEYLTNCTRNDATPLLDFNVMSSDFYYQLGMLYESRLYGEK